MKCGLLEAGMWSVRGALASRKPKANMGVLGCKFKVGSADPAQSLRTRALRFL
ncbi:hypothetical protein [Pseudovibrio sp. Ad26]|uniref:hypothetical protein n=1 Tax=Pseudovibrio sp. Ad26 TaxID=989410 RepID=UPI0007B1FE4F|nr:hypothetical protein [Pseudovibrio sp. Ad26]KZL16526.1 hypothetical protein PsAD26_00301 [Pseudovibrio sp. Ad26]